MSDDAGAIVWLKVRDAAQVHQIDPRTVRKRIEKGELVGKKVDGSWWVASSREEIAEAGLDLTAGPEGEDPAPEGTVATIRDPHPAPALDLAPLAETIEAISRLHAAERRDLEARIEQLAAQAAMWQERAETYARQLGPGPDPAPRSWWDRLLGR